MLTYLVTSTVYCVHVGNKPCNFEELSVTDFVAIWCRNVACSSLVLQHMCLTVFIHCKMYFWVKEKSSCYIHVAFKKTDLWLLVILILDNFISCFRELIHKFQNSNLNLIWIKVYCWDIKWVCFALILGFWLSEGQYLGGWSLVRSLLGAVNREVVAQICIVLNQSYLHWRWW